MNNNLEIKNNKNHIMVSNHYFSGVTEEEIIIAYEEAFHLFQLNPRPLNFEDKTYCFSTKELSEIKRSIILGDMYIQCINKEENTFFEFNLPKNLFLNTCSMQLEVYWASKKKYKHHLVAMELTKHTLSLTRNELLGFQNYLTFLENR